MVCIGIRRAQQACIICILQNTCSICIVLLGHATLNVCLRGVGVYLPTDPSNIFPNTVFPHSPQSHTATNLTCQDAFKMHSNIGAVYMSVYTDAVSHAAILHVHGTVAPWRVSDIAAIRKLKIHSQGNKMSITTISAS